MMSLFKVAQCNRILVDYFDFDDCFYGLYIKYENKRPLILLHKDLPRHNDLSRCIFAEELGHHFTTVGNTLHCHKNYGDLLHVSKIEMAALKWAGHYLIKDDKLFQALNGQPSLYELAIFFNVTETFMRIRLEIFQEEEYWAKHGNLHQRLYTKETTRQLAGSFSIF